jgi:hypothetical protein
MIDLSVIDSEEKAYCLGLLASDGAIDNHGRHNGVTLRLKFEDVGLLCRVRDIMDHTRLISVVKNNYTYRGQKKTIYYPNLSIHSKKLCGQLSTYGIIQNKTFSLRAPDYLEDSLVKHWVRGYFDGDGCIYLKRKNPVRWNANIVSGSLSVLEFIRNWFLDNSSIRYYIAIYPIKRKSLYYQLNFDSEPAQKFLEIIYRHSSIHMDRKYNLSRTVLETPLEGPVRLKWTNEEKNLLKSLYKNDRSKLRSLLPHREGNSIALMASRLGLTKTMQLEKNPSFC